MNKRDKMGIPNKIVIGNGNNRKEKYFLWEKYDSFEEAKTNGKRIKGSLKQQGRKISYFIIESKESWFLPVPEFGLYFNRRRESV